ncbi:unnamed protein product [Meloidogyne enterolobii]|uniref:Uncharacterized protein n=1 Tax=Meloidogyne enterolobii TaxID=390850 RepID=A0ACB0Z9B4_MELEN
MLNCLPQSPPSLNIPPSKYISTSRRKEKVFSFLHFSFEVFSKKERRSLIQKRKKDFSKQNC